MVVEKATRTLALLRDGLVLRRYEVALGRRPWGPKQREGDGRTPEGFYRIDGRNAGSRFHRALRVSYPSREDARRAGEMGRAPGGMIMIHGLPQGLSVRSLGHPWRDWTDGCIAVTNEEIEEIWRLVNDGTPVLIQP